MRYLILPFIVVLALLSGCAGQPTSQQSFSSEGHDIDSFEGFGEALKASMEARDTSFFVQRFDNHRFAERSLHAVGLAKAKQKTIDAYAKVMGKALDNRFNQTFARIKSAKFLRLLPDKARQPGEAVALIRINPDSGGINYWEVHMERIDAEIRIVDWFSYSLGDLASRSLGRFVLQVGVAKLKPESKLAGQVNDYLAAAQSGDPQKLIDAYDRLPKNFRNNSLLMYSQVQTSKKISEVSYEATLRKLAPLYQSNDDYALMLVDYYIYVKDYGKAHLAIDAVARKIGDDAALDSLHAGIGLASGDYNSAIAYARDGISKEASYEDNYWVLLDALVFTQNYADAVLVLNILEEGFGYSFDRQKLATLEGYEPFARSPEFKSWRTAASY